MSCSVISQKILLFGGGGPKIPFFENLAQKGRTQKHFKFGVSANKFFEKITSNETAILGP